jgi:hypothetical protein
VIYILIVIMAVKYRYLITERFQDDDDEVYEILKPGAGLEYQEPAKRRAPLRVVK